MSESADYLSTVPSEPNLDTENIDEVSELVGEVTYIPFVPDLSEENTGEVKDDAVLVYDQILSDMRISCWKELAIHGHYKGPGSEPASLIVLKYRLTNKNTEKEQRRFRSFFVQLTFRQNTTPGDPLRDDPVVKASEPAFQGTIYLTETISTITHESTYGFTGGVQGPPQAPIALTFNMARKKGTEYESRFIYQVQSDRELSQDHGPNSRGQDMVYWNSLENQTQPVGIGDIFQVAVIVSRKNDEKFVINAQHDALISFRYKTAKKWKKWNPFKAKAPTDPVTEINPKEDFGEIPAGVDRDNLAALEKNGKLKELALIHQPEKWAPPFHPGETEKQ